MCLVCSHVHILDKYNLMVLVNEEYRRHTELVSHVGWSYNVSVRLSGCPSKEQCSYKLQLGFKKNTGCAPGLFLMQNVTSFFACRNSSVYIAALDASKAFDRINHDVLFQKLILRGVPRCFIGVLVNWYSKLWFSVRWNGTLSPLFKVNCGIRQGGILSSILFNLYVDELIQSLSVSDYSCFVGKKVF